MADKDELVFEDVDLDIDMSGAEINRPVLKKGSYRLRIDGFQKETNKAGTGENLIAHLSTAVENQSTEGKPIPSGYKMKQWISLMHKEGKYNPADALAKLTVAAGLPMEGKFRTAPLVGREVVAHIDVEPFGAPPEKGEADDRPMSNKISYFILPKQAGSGSGSGGTESKAPANGGLEV